MTKFGSYWHIEDLDGTFREVTFAKILTEGEEGKCGQGGGEVLEGG